MINSGIFDQHIQVCGYRCARTVSLRTLSYKLHCLYYLTGCGHLVSILHARRRYLEQVSRENESDA